MGRSSGSVGKARGHWAARPNAGRREHRQRFWLAIARGLSSENAAAAAGVSSVVGARWFREGGGMRTVSVEPLSGRYLSFIEREEIAIMRARGCGVRHIAGELGRSPSTISRELARNSTRVGTGGGIARPRRSGMPTSVPSVPSLPNWRSMTGCVPMCKTVCRVRSADLMGWWWLVHRYAGMVGDMDRVSTDVGPKHGALSRSPTG